MHLLQLLVCVCQVFFYLLRRIWLPFYTSVTTLFYSRQGHIQSQTNQESTTETEIKVKQRVKDMSCVYKHCQGSYEVISPGNGLELVFQRQICVLIYLLQPWYLGTCACLRPRMCVQTCVYVCPHNAYRRPWKAGDMWPKMSNLALPRLVVLSLGWTPANNTAWPLSCDGFQGREEERKGKVKKEEEDESIHCDVYLFSWSPRPRLACLK